MSEKFTWIQLGRKKQKAYYELQELKNKESLTGESCIFAYCYYNTYSDKESRVFIVYPSYLDFVKVMKDSTQKTFHEVIQTDSSFRVFFDIDALPNQNNNLFKYDISNWDHNKIPETEEKQNMTISYELEFLLYHFDESKFEENRVSCRIFYEDYLNYCLKNYITPKKINKIDLSPYAIHCKWNSGKIRGFKKLFTKENELIKLHEFS
jgi:hypothetical protein